MKAIGGYLDLEITDFGSIYHDDAIALNSGRNAFEYILLCKGYKHIYIPYYTCDVLLEPLKKHNIKYTYYSIDENFMPIIDTIAEGSGFLYTNYFGLMKKNIVCLVKNIDNLIIDNAQSFYDKPIDGIPTFYSPRKFFGLPDGGFVYNSNEISIEGFEFDISSDRMSHLISRIEHGAEAGYKQFKTNEDVLINKPIMRMSKLTQKLMMGINYAAIKNKRISNFYLLHEKLKHTNELTKMIDNTDLICPMVYPYLRSGNKKLRSRLIDSKIFTAQYWPNIIDCCSADSIEYRFSNDIIHLPVDQRWNKNDINFILNKILN